MTRNNSVRTAVCAGRTAVQCIIVVAADTIRADCDLCDPSAIVYVSPRPRIVASKRARPIAPTMTVAVPLNLM